MSTTSDMLNQALQHHQAGRLREAESLYTQILAIEPGNADALHLLGLVAYQTGRYATAVELIERAVSRFDRQAAWQANLGEAYRAMGKLTEAEHYLHQALRLDQNLPDARNSLGNVLLARGKIAEAVIEYKNAIALRPDFAEAHNNLGAALRVQGDDDGAIAAFRRAAQLNPNYPAALVNLGDVLLARREFEEARAAYEHVLRLDPKHVGALVNLAFAMENLGRLNEALACCDRAIAIRSDCAEAHLNRASVLRLKRMIPQAITAYQTALRLQPNLAEAYNGLALLYLSINHIDEAIEISRRGLQCADRPAALYANLSAGLQEMGRADEAIAYARKSVESDPANVKAHSNLLYQLNFHPAYDPSAVFAEHLAWGARHAELLTAGAAPHSNDRTPERRLRIGYVSPYFRDHAVNFFFEPIIAHHDHSEFEIYCYSDVSHPDNVTSRLRAAADHWRDSCYASDNELARAIRDDAIDILVDLTGHIGGHRLLAFARKPAPVQVTYLGYQNTTGMSAMDYRLTDSRADPPGMSDAYYTERLVRLPRCFFCYQPAAEAPGVAPLPAIQSGCITFGSLNNFAKVSPPVIDAWLDILSRVDQSRLMMITHVGKQLRGHIDELARSRGLDPARIDLCPKCPRADYFRLLAKVDIALDPFPFNGHTTTCDCVWMGVPVIMLEGQTYASRFGGSVLANVGLERMITSSISEYVDRAAELADASNQPELVELRSRLRPRMADSVLLDYTGFTRNLEAAYREMWRDWATKETPCNISPQ